MTRPRGDREDSIDRYTKDLSSSQPLPAEEERKLAYRMKQGDVRAREKLINANLRFVVSVAREYQNRGLPLPDLISAGNLGLVLAAGKFDPTKGLKFITYAVWWIRQSVQKTLTEDSRASRLPESRIVLLRKASKYADSYQKRHGSTPSNEQVAEELDVPLSLLKDTLMLPRRPLSLGTPMFDDDRGLLECLADESQEAPDGVLMHNSLRAGIADVLNTLPEREQEVLSLYYGLNGAPAMTLKSIGGKIGLTRERVRQIKEGALTKLSRLKNPRKLLSDLEGV